MLISSLTCADGTRERQKTALHFGCVHPTLVSVFKADQILSVSVALRNDFAAVQAVSRDAFLNPAASQQRKRWRALCMCRTAAIVFTVAFAAFKNFFLGAD